MKAIEEVLEGINHEEEQSFQPFVVNDLETAAEAQRRIAFFEDQKKDIDSIIEKQIAPFLAKIEKIKAWGEEAKKEHIEKQEHYSNQLELYIRSEVEKQMESGKKPKKTINLPYGSISLKKQEPEFQKDEEHLLEYARKIGFFKIKETVDWAGIKKTHKVVDGKMINEDGEVVPGVVAIEREDKFTLKLE
ncbi:host-nuclease inhibitor Gam family protein [Bacillus sp. FJAT-49732]|uniref:Host-nuclease inhibitor Gam family protein n=1 Tax=Lederbergia citrisecunda TaxID=2833583 RepID=A0A942TP62_9BACI|nr:host-nuclease inhibitor Gam family protein [Lederbergia citrisecunda]MBS4200307.1 host-nuclease inhibitor Gam family protein [Lederbergia citrisecunda]